MFKLNYNKANMRKLLLLVLMFISGMSYALAQSAVTGLKDCYSCNTGFTLSNKECKRNTPSIKTPAPTISSQ